jgi:predicted acetyltransferase
MVFDCLLAAKPGIYVSNQRLLYIKCMKPAQLTLMNPHKIYQDSFKRYVLSYQSSDDQSDYRKYEPALSDFDAYLSFLHHGSIPKNQAKTWIFTSTFWLIDQEEVVGVVRVRHDFVPFAGHIGYDIAPIYRRKGYGQIILNLALEKARELGLKHVILFCTIDNIASKKIIERNGGIYLQDDYDALKDEHFHRYQINL